MSGRIAAMAASAIAIGLGVPALLIYAAAVYHLDLIFTGIMIFLALLGAVGAPAVIGALSYQEMDDSSYLRRQNSILRSGLAEALKQIDELNDNLEKLLDILKAEV